MRLKGLFALLLCVLLLPRGVLANPWEMRLPFEQATINYELSGMETGTEVLYIQNHGKKTARYRTTSTSVLGMIRKNETVEIVDPDWIYTFDLKEGTGTKSINPQKLMIEEYNKLSAADKEKVEENARKMGAAVTGGMQGAVEPNATEILGYSCDRATMLGATVYSIHETPIALLSESTMLGISMKSAATSIDEGSVDESHFNFPEGIEPQPDAEADQMARMVAKQTIAMLKDPEGFKRRNQGVIGLPSDKEGDISEEDKKQMEEAMKALKGLFGN